MAIRDVVTMGYGNGTYDPGVNKLPTLGYAIGEVVLSTPMLVVAYDAYRAGPAAIDAYNASAQEYDQ